MEKLEKKYTVLFVDDEIRILNALRSIFRRQYTVFIATSGSEALSILAAQKIDVIVSDQRMPKMLGNELLATVHRLYPKIMRLLLTGFVDKEAIIKTINEGEIYRFINKPWNNDDIQKTVAEAARASHFYSQQLLDRRRLDDTQNALEQNDDITDTDALPEQMSGNSIVMMGSNQELRNQVRHICRMSDIHIYGGQSIPQVIGIISARDNIGVAIIELPINSDEAIHTINMLKEKRPELVSIVLADETDAETAIQLINTGQVFRYLTKPLQTLELSRILKQAIVRHNMLHTDDNIKKRYNVEKPRKTLSSHLKELFSSFARA